MSEPIPYTQLEPRHFMMRHCIESSRGRVRDIKTCVNSVIPTGFELENDGKKPTRDEVIASIRRGGFDVDEKKFPENPICFPRYKKFTKESDAALIQHILANPMQPSKPSKLTLDQALRLEARRHRKQL